MRKIAFIKYACNASLWDVSYIFVLFIVGDILVCHSPKICIKSSSESGWQINLPEYEMGKKNLAPPQKQKDCWRSNLLTLFWKIDTWGKAYLGPGARHIWYQKDFSILPFCYTRSRWLETKRKQKLNGNNHSFRGLQAI